MKPILIAVMIGLGAVSFTPAVALAAKPPVYKGLISPLAVSGYDPVAYFTVGKPVQGDAKFSTEWNGATWRFSSAANLAKFKASPAVYAPQFGGYCAWAVAQGYTASGDPKQWKIVGGKLYLNYNAEVQSKWVKDIPGFISSGNANWPKVLSK